MLEFSKVTDQIRKGSPSNRYHTHDKRTQQIPINIVLEIIEVRGFRFISISLNYKLDVPGYANYEVAHVCNC